MFLRGEKEKSDALTDLLHRYLEFLYQNYLKQKKNRIWMREGDLDKPLGELYQNRNLRDVLCKQSTTPREVPSILVFQGEKGDGRSFFVKKMIEACYENIHHLVWTQVADETVELRFPVYVRKDMTQGLTEYDLINLAYQCLIRQLELAETQEKRDARTLIEKLGNMGKLAVFFEEESCAENPELIEQLYIPSDQIYQPIAVFTEQPQYSPQKWGRGCYIRMEPLTEEQMAVYLSSELPLLYGYKSAQEMLQKYREVAAILNKPERMEIYVRVTKNDSELGPEPITINQIYDAFLAGQIEEACKSTPGKAFTEDNLRTWLTQRARGIISQGPDEDRQFLECFQDTDMFRRRSDDFCFEGCKHYLIAKSYFQADMKPGKAKEKLKTILMNDDLMVLNFFAELYVSKHKKPEFLFKQLTELVDTPIIRNKYNEPAELLADVLIFTNRVEADATELVKWACKEMTKYTYDTSVLETLSRLNRRNPNASITKYLEEEYIKSTVPRVKRRISYCFGYMGQGAIPECLIQDLIQPAGDKEKALHLQYHIIVSLVDSCREKDEIGKYFSEMEEKLGHHTDPILRSDFEVLYYKLNGGTPYRESQKECENQLIRLLETGPYWQQAHAAGALGRRRYERDSLEITIVTGNLTTVLGRNLSEICNLHDEGRAKLKTVSYIVEACCQLAENNKCEVEMQRQLWQVLEDHINNLPDTEISIVAYKHLQVAWNLVVTGLKHLLGGTESIRKELGLCFSSKINLLSEFFKQLPRESGSGWQGLRDMIKHLEDWITPENAKKEIRKLFPEQPKRCQRIDYSLGYLWYQNIPKVIGFLFLYHGDIYFITCRHWFFQENDRASTLCAPQEELEHVKITPACLGMDRCYHGVKCYPKNLMTPASFDQSAKDDMVIYRVHDIHAMFSQVIFSEKNLPDSGQIRPDDTLDAFSFAEASQTMGSWFHCKDYEEIAHNFFNMNATAEFDAADANCFSGAPIIKKTDTLVGMWKSCRTEKKKILGITVQAILDQLENINKNGSGDHE